MKTLKKAFCALILSVLIFIVLPGHIMMYLEEQRVKITDVDFGDDIPDDYYDQECPIDYLRLGGDPRDWLDGLRWNRPYKPNEWDCSTQAAFLEWALTCCGYEADILVGASHAWLMVDVGDGWEQYEQTFGAFLGEGLEMSSTSYWKFDDLNEVHGFFGERWKKYPNRWIRHSVVPFEEWFLAEWGWWKLEEGDE